MKMSFMALISALVLMILSISGCRYQQDFELLDTSDSLVIHTDWLYNTSHSGVFRDEASGQEYIFSGDPVTHLKIRVFDGMGRLLHDIPLNAALASLDDIGSIIMITKDSALVLESLGARYVVLDVLGQVARRGSLLAARCDSEGDFYELYATRGGPVVLGGKVYLETDWAGTCTDRVSEWQPATEVEYFQRYFASATRKCKLAQLDPRDDSAPLRFGACNILQHLADTPRITIGTAHSVSVNGKLLLFSPYSGFLHIVDTSSLSIAQKIPVNYAKHEVGITPPPISIADIRNDSANIRLATKSQIMTCVFDNSNKRYLVTICHDVPLTSPEAEQSFLRDWSLIVLNESFEPIAEHVISGKEYSATVFLGLERGTWVLQRKPGRQDPKARKIFHRLHPE